MAVQSIAIKPPRIHGTSIIHGDRRSARRKSLVVKIPVPSMLATTRAVALPKPRVGAGWLIADDRIAAARPPSQIPRGSDKISATKSDAAAEVCFAGPAGAGVCRGISSKTTSPRTVFVLPPGVSSRARKL